MNAIEVQNLCKEYKGFRLDSVNLTLPSGCIMGLIGENGAGKSTLIKLIMGASCRDSGQIRVLGQDNRKDFSRVKEDIGIVLSEPAFPEELSAKQMQKVLRHAYKNWDDEAFEAYMEKLHLPKDKAFKSYSRGMKMKLAIAAALSHRAKLLILDEATAGLDPIVRDEILDIFFEFTRQADHSILISSHIVSDLEKLCDYICFIHQGKVLFTEEKDLLKEKYGVLHCTQEQFEAIDSAAVKGVRHGKYGLEVLVERGLMPADAVLQQPSIEEIIVYVARGGVVL